ncbi:hypothetical protein HYT02_02370 [Candidatus Gottesmanbacteria bacterium]|nr:hypothetical protein [Candidatus Gottesmanbacteria bacterium]
MSSDIELFLKRNPILTKYIKSGLVNITSLAKYIKKSANLDQKTTVASIGMFIRRYVSKLPKITNRFYLPGYKPQLVIRTGVHELIFIKNKENREESLKIFKNISITKYFSCVVEGEKEIVVLTDYPIKDLLKKKGLKNKISHITDELGFISIDFPIKLREVLGVYNYVTQALFLANISIHSFHTIGGEILILVKNQDLIKAQEVLSSALQTV